MPFIPRSADCLGLRLINLGLLTLMDYEAKFALEALQISNGLPGVLASNPAYTHLTTMLFYILGGADFWARFWPALAGAGLVLAAWFLRSHIGRLPAIVLAFGLALDPGLNAISRLAGGPMLAISFLVLAGVLWLARYPIPAGIFFALGLLSGPDAWFGLVTVLLAWGLYRSIPGKFFRDTFTGVVDTKPDDSFKPIAMLKEAVLWGVGALLLLGSLMMISPQGLAAMVRSVLEYAAGWWQPSGIPFWRVLLALPGYELLPLFLWSHPFGTWHRPARKNCPPVESLVFCFAPAGSLYPGRQGNDLCWALVPLWMLAAREIGRYFNFSLSNRWVVGGTLTAIFILLVLAWLTLTRISTFDLTSSEVPLAVVVHWWYSAGYRHFPDHGGDRLVYQGCHAWGRLGVLDTSVLVHSRGGNWFCWVA